MAYVWMQVTRDKYELPVAVADTAVELARIVGTNSNNVRSAVAHVNRGDKKWSRFVRVEIDENDQE